MLKALYFLLTLSTLQAADLESALSKLRAEYNIPALGVMVTKSNKVLALSASGYRKIGFPEKAETSNKFHLGSCTKAMTATLAAIFVEEGKLNWSDTLRDLFPELKVHQDFKKIRFDQLLVHRTGIAANPNPNLYEQLSKLKVSKAREKLAKIFLTKRPKHEVGTYNYSNIGYIVAGHVLERLSGKSWEKLMASKIFSPLKMNCGFGPTSSNEEVRPTQPWGHIQRAGNPAVAFQGDNALFYGPAGTVHCSMMDWNKFLDIHIDGFNGTDSILKSSSFKKLHTPYSEEGETYTYGGWRRLERRWAKGVVFTHTGSNTLNFSNVWIAPKVEASLIGVANKGGEDAWTATNKVIEKAIKLID